MIRAMTTLADDLVSDELWALVEPLLPTPPRPPYGGRHRTIPDRNCFAAIVYMARTSTPWRLLPARELGCGSPTTCWRRLTEWANVGVFDQLHLKVLDRLGVAGRLDWSWASVDTMSVRAKRGGTMWAQIRSIVASLGASFTWSVTVAGCR
jgi:transposase